MARSVARMISLVLLVLVATRAEATDRHEVVGNPKPLARRGKLLGFRMTVRLWPDSYQDVRVGLGRNGGVGQGGTDRETKLRLLAAGELSGYLRYQLPEIQGLKRGQPHEVELEVLYGVGNDLRPGDQVDVISAWRGPSSLQYESKDYSYWHVFGMTDGPVQRGDQVKRLPGSRWKLR